MRIKCNTKFTLDRRSDSTGTPIVTNLPINMDFTFEGKRLRFFTGYRIDADKWIDTKKTDPDTGEIIHIQQVKKNAYNKAGESYGEINKRLLLLKTTITKIYEESVILGKSVTVAYLRDELRRSLNEEKKPAEEMDTDFFSVYQRYVDTVDVTPGTRKQIAAGKNHIERYVRYGLRKKTVEFDEITPAWIEKYWAYIINDSEDNEAYKSLPIKNRPRKKCKNSAVGVLRRLRAFLNWAALPQNGALVKVNPFATFSIPAEQYGRPIYLTKEERDRLYEAKISNTRLSRVRDIFVFQCLTGCRVGDLVKLKKDNIVNGAIEYIPTKTKTRRAETVRVPLSEKALNILSRYDLPDGSLLPFISDQRYNDYIKELFKLEEVCLDRLVTRLNPMTLEEEQVPLYEIATSHMARRTFVGTLHKQNVKNEIIASMSGHVKTSRAFARYYDIDNETQNEVVKNYLD